MSDTPPTPHPDDALALFVLAWQGAGSVPDIGAPWVEAGRPALAYWWAERRLR